MQGFRPEAVARALKKPEPEPRPSWLTWENGLKLVALGTKVGSAYYKHQRYWSEREQRVLEAARLHHGWLTEAELLEALEYRPQEVSRVVARLCEQGWCRQLVSRLGAPLYLFEAFLPPLHFCEYCDQERAPGLVACGCCGAP